jgi:acyl-CoA synthetase (AMP-forming)/AMP-acid ligase II
MDRAKDMIISGGFNIYPSDLEAVLVALMRHKFLCAVAMPVLSRCSDISRDDVKMFLSLRADALAPMAKASPVAAARSERQTSGASDHTRRG